VHLPELGDPFPVIHNATITEEHGSIDHKVQALHSASQHIKKNLLKIVSRSISLCSPTLGHFQFCLTLLHLLSLHITGVLSSVAIKGLRPQFFLHAVLVIRNIMVYGESSIQGKKRNVRFGKNEQ
jgi:hypothetical protein